MKFPQAIKKLNSVLVVFAGALLALNAVFAAIEVVARKFFMHPTTWSLNVSQYLLIWAILLASASSFEHKSHVSVDFIRSAFARRFGLIIARVLSIISYLACLTYVVVLGWKTVEMMQSAFKTNKLTQGTIQIQANYLYAAIVVGVVLMALTLVCIILDLLGGGKEYLSEEELQ